jgi:dTDP-4-amino-4,6-dideoxy-D-galactose acyltransferase
VSPPTSPTPPSFEPLAWDSVHFGMAVGRLAGELHDESTLAPLLEHARAAGAQLVYYLHVRPWEVSSELLARYGGAWVAGYVRFARALAPVGLPRPTPGVALEVYRGGADDAGLLALGVGAGWLSRFRNDQRLSGQKCDDLYTIWTRRSLVGELADETLVARIDDAPVGLVTYRVHDGFGEIGLVGMAPAARGRGIGSALLAYTHARLTARGVARAEVVTQTENEGACRLYRRAGYVPLVEGCYYHFHLAWAGL